MKSRYLLQRHSHKVQLLLRLDLAWEAKYVLVQVQVQVELLLELLGLEGLEEQEELVAIICNR